MPNTKNRFLAIAFLIIAAMALAFAIISFSLYTGVYVRYESYGGDAYTGIQNAAAGTAYNVSLVARCITIVAGFSFLTVFAIFLTLGLTKLIYDSKIVITPAQPKTNPLNSRIQETEEKQHLENVFKQYSK